MTRNERGKLDHDYAESRLPFAVVFVLICTIGVFIGFGLGLFFLKDPPTEGFISKNTVVLSFSVGSTGTSILKTGWSNPERWGVWSDGERAELPISLPGKLASDVSVILDASAFVAPPVITKREVAIEVNGSEIGRITFSETDALQSNRTFVLPKSVATRQDPMLLVFKFTDVRSPAELGLGGPLSKETRKLGIGLRRITLNYSMEL